MGHEVVGTAVRTLRERRPNEIKCFWSFPPANVGRVLAVRSPPLVRRVTLVFGWRPVHNHGKAIGIKELNL